MKKLILIPLLAVSLIGGGCATSDWYEETTTTHNVTASADSVINDDGTLTPVAEYTGDLAAAVEADRIIAEGETRAVTITTLVPRQDVTATINGIGQTFPGWGSMASLIANGVLGIGALWLGKKKAVTDRVAESLVKGIDTFRDVLDQSPQGAVVDQRLTEILAKYKNELGVMKQIGQLLERFSTPTKTPLALPAPMA
jgi:hypothetical protein